MITSFFDHATADVYNGVSSRRARRLLSTALHEVARRRLDMLNEAIRLEDLAAVPGNQLEKLMGDLRGKYSLRINQQYRIVFEFHEGNASSVAIRDYH